MVFSCKCSIVGAMLCTANTGGIWLFCVNWWGCWSFSFDVVIISCIFHRRCYCVGVVYPTLLYWGTPAIMFALITLPLRLMHWDVCVVLSSLDMERCNNKYDTKEVMFHKSYCNGLQHWLSNLHGCHGLQTVVEIVGLGVFLISGSFYFPEQWTKAVNNVGASI